MSATVLSPLVRGSHPARSWADAPATHTPRTRIPRVVLKGGEVRNPVRNGNMRLTRPSTCRSFGSLHIGEEVQVLELDAHGPDGTRKDVYSTCDWGGASRNDTVQFSREALDKVLSDMVIVVPCKDEELPVIKGVISAIPARCLVILVSNGHRYAQQVEMLSSFEGYRRQVLAIHQKDAGAAGAFRASGMHELLDPTDRTIRDGKGEGMILGIALAATFCPNRRYIGFVDADNFNAGSVNEYCKAFAAGFAMSPSPEAEHTMVRLRWSSKPKLRRDGQVEFVTEGRCSRVVNSWLNRLFASKSKPLVTTGNAGEHAMTMGLALKLRMAAGYAIEPFHFVDMLERCHLCGSADKAARQASGHQGGGTKKAAPKSIDKEVRVLQVRTLNPHFHRSSDDEHIRHMWAAGLGSIYHALGRYDSDSDSDSDEDTIAQLRKGMHAFADEEKVIDGGIEELPRPKIYPALEDMDMVRFRKSMETGQGAETLRAFGFKVPHCEGCSTWS